MANLRNSSAFARANDPVFARECLEAHVLAVISHHQTSFAAMEQQLASMPESELKKALKQVPYRKLLVDEAPINDLCVKTEKMLWHQRLGHPCDEYLYNAHKTVDGVPKFANVAKHSPIDQCVIHQNYKVVTLM